MSSGPVKLVIAAYGVTKHGEEGSGTWQQFPSEPWSGKDENFCIEGNGLDPPLYDNFDRIWCSDAAVRNGLGHPTQYDSRKLGQIFGVGNIQLMLAQGFANGFIFRDSDGETYKKAYVFLNNGSFVREGY